MLARLLRWSERAPKPERLVRFGAHEFRCREDKTLLDAALDAGVPMNYSCQVGACGTCRCRVVSGSFRTLKGLDYLLSADEIRTGVTLACQTTPETDLVLEPGGVTHPARISSCMALGDGVVELRLQPKFRVLYQLGQFVDVVTPTGVSRPFSMVDLGDGADGELVFHVKLRPSGAMSRFLAEQLGDSRDDVRVGEAQGEIERQANGSYERVLCFAGGSGLGVCASVARAMTAQGRASCADFITVSRSGSSGYHERLLAAVPREHRGSFSLALAYPELFELESPALQQVRAELARCPDTLVVLCGSSTLVEQGREWLEQAGLAPERLWVIPFTRTTAAQNASGGQPEVLG